MPHFPIPDPSLTFLLVKILVTASIVVGASVIAERSGPFLAAMVATLPVSAGPVYFFLALDHDDAFISEAALGSIDASFATLAFSVSYVLVAQRAGTALSLGMAFAAWAAVLFVFKILDPNLSVSLALIAAGFSAAHLGLRRYFDARADGDASLAWYVIPLRAMLVAALVAIVTTISWRIGAQWSGFFATFPVVLSTLILFLHSRMGGKATAAIIGSGIRGLMGFSFALVFVHVAAVPIGKWAALALGLGLCLIWNLALVFWSRRG